MGIRIGVDLMGGDQSPQVVFDAALEIARQLNSVDRLFAISSEQFLSQLKRHISPTLDTIPLEFVVTDEVIEMDEPPLLAVRRKKKSSMAVGIRLLKEHKLDAFVSCGNTGALVALSMLTLPMLPKIERCALLIQLPMDVVVLDVGANLTAKPEHLVAYGKLGCAFQHCIKGLNKPKVGLLNIGSEAQKGTHDLKDAYQRLQETFKKQFVGNIEGRELFLGKVDVVVTDGFTGNVFLKTSEGVSKFLIEYMRKEFREAEELVAHLHRRFDYSAHPGALLCGVDGLVVKCHGHSNKIAVMNAIRGAIELVEKGVLKGLKELV